MCWYVLERYLYSLTNTSHLTPEFQKHSLGIGLSPAPSFQSLSHLSMALSPHSLYNYSAFCTHVMKNASTCMYNSQFYSQA